MKIVDPEFSIVELIVYAVVIAVAIVIAIVTGPLWVLAGL